MQRKFGDALRTDGEKFNKNSFADYVAEFADGTIDKICLKTFGLIETVGSKELRNAMQREKFNAIITTIKDWIRKLKTGDLL